MLFADRLHFVDGLLGCVAGHPAVGLAAHLVTGRLGTSAIDCHRLFRHDRRVSHIIIRHSLRLVLLARRCTWVEAESLLLLLRGRREVTTRIHKYICLVHLQDIHVGFRLDLATVARLIHMHGVLIASPARRAAVLDRILEEVVAFLHRGKVDRLRIIEIAHGTEA